MEAIRMKPHRILSTLIAALATMLLFAGPALAYLDPASSTFILQSIVAAVFGGLYFIKLNWMRLKAFFAGGTVESTSAKGASGGEEQAEDEQAEK
jgi:hypothetical protein